MQDCVKADGVDAFYKEDDEAPTGPCVACGIIVVVMQCVNFIATNCRGAISQPKLSTTHPFT